MAFTNEGRQAVTNYFRGFADALGACLREWQGQLPACWGGIDSQGVSAVVYFADDGFIARIVPRLADGAVLARSDVALKDVLQERWAGAGIRIGEEVFGAALVKPLAARTAISMSVVADSLVVAPKEAGGAILVVAPLLRGGLTKDQVARIQSLKNDREREAAGLAVPMPPWFASVVAVRTGGDALKGLDADPGIAARGVADAIGRCAGVLQEDAAAGYRREREALQRSEPASPRIERLQRLEAAATFMGTR